MKLTAKQRLIAFALILALVTAIIGWALRGAWSALAEVKQLDAIFKTEVGREAERLANMQSQYSEISSHVKEEIGALNNLLVAAVSRNDQQAAASYRSRSQQLAAWIQQREKSVTQMELILNTQPSVTRLNVKQLVQEIDQAYQDYLTNTRQLTEPAGASADPSQRFKQLMAAQSNLEQVVTLANQAHVQSEAIKLSLFSSNQWFPSMHNLVFERIPSLHRQLILASIASVVGLCTALIVVVYRLWVSPLRVKLVESSAIIDSQRKLAHFGELAAGLAHEIRNPLTAINARLFTLQKSVTRGTPEYEDAQVIRTEINRLDRIVKDFLKLARPAEPQFVPMEAAPILNDVRALLAPEYQKNNIEMKLGSITNARFLADPQQLKQVLINLVQNAAESIQHDGTVSLSVREHDQRLHGKHINVVIIEVADTGPGIPPNVLKRLFDPFFSTKDGGTGLGLAISHSIVAKHGGTLEVQTDPHSGTKFGIVLPALNKPDES